MQIGSIDGYLISIYEESVLKAFNFFNPLRVSSLDIGFWYFSIS